MSLFMHQSSTVMPEIVTPELSPEPARSPFYGTQSLPELKSSRRRNVMMVWDPVIGQIDDFRQIATCIKQIDPKVRPLVIDSKASRITGLLLSTVSPSLVFSPIPLARFRPLRGRRFVGVHLSKSEEYAALEKAGIPVPKWTLVTDDPGFDLSGFSPYLVTKPNRGSRGALVRIRRRGRVRYEPPQVGVDPGVGKNGPLVAEDTQLLAQEFVYTGQWPISYRITTLFGKVVHSYKIEASHERAALPGPDGFDREKNAQGVTIVSSSKGCTMEPNFDEETIRLGEAAAAAFPDVPVLGVDVVREVPSGKLYVLEVNAFGYVWNFSSSAGLRLQREFNFSLDAQFDGLRKAAHLLIAKAQEIT